MPIATPEVYEQMLDRAKAGAFAYPAINVTSSQTLLAALRGFAEAESDGIVQVSTGGAAAWSGFTVKDMVRRRGRVRRVRQGRRRAVPGHRSRCTPTTARRTTSTASCARWRRSPRSGWRGEAPLFNSHMWDGSAVELEENLDIAEEMLELCTAGKTILEMEIGVVGGEEDGIVGEMNEKLYSTPEDALATAERSASGSAVATCSPRPSATCTASTSPGT
jgi:fructose-bisphosphate aldolase, class II